MIRHEKTAVHGVGLGAKWTLAYSNTCETITVSAGVRKFQLRLGLIARGVSNRGMRCCELGVLLRDP